MLEHHNENITVELVMRKDTMNMEGWVEICLQSEVPMFNPLATSSAPTASTVKGTEKYTNRLTGVHLYRWFVWFCLVMPEKQVHLFNGSAASVKGCA